MPNIRTLSGVSSLNKANKCTSFYYSLNQHFPSVKDLLNNDSIHTELLPRKVDTCFRIAFLYFCRIGELLDCSFSDHIAPDRLVCKGKKGSLSYVIYLPGLSRLIHDHGYNDLSVRIFPFTYAYLYSWAKRIGIRSRLSGRSNTAVLHLSRYIFSNKCSDRAPDHVVSECLRHRSVNSVSYYLNKGVSSNG